VGGVAATSVTVVSPTSLSFVTPANAVALSSTAADNARDIVIHTGAGSATLAGGYTYTSEWARIFGSLNHIECRFGDPRVALNGGHISSLPNLIGGAVNDLGQSTASHQPLFEATGWNGGPSGLADGVDDYLVKNPLNPTIPAGQRAYVIVAIQMAATGASKNVASLANAAGSEYVRGIINSTNYTMERKDNGTANTSTISTTPDTNRHLVEMGFTAGGSKSYVVDGVTADNTRTAGAATALTVASLFCYFDALFFANARSAFYGVLSDAPSAQNLTDARAFLKGAHFPGYAGNSLGLP
jgi:hypothetical protein